MDSDTKDSPMADQWMRVFRRGRVSNSSSFSVYPPLGTARAAGFASLSATDCTLILVGIVSFTSIPKTAYFSAYHMFLHLPCLPGKRRVRVPKLVEKAVEKGNDD